MERIVNIATNDQHLIYGTLNYIDPEAKDLIIFIHGLSDNKDHRLVFNASKFFKTNGYKTYRFSLYSDEPKARILDDSSISTFKEDIDSVINHFRGGYENIFIVCHSLGFVVLDCDLRNIQGVILWDPSLALKKERIESLRLEPLLNKYFINWGVSFIISKQLKTEWENINDERLLSKVEVPLCLIMAENSDLRVGWKENLKHIKTEYHYNELKGASHGFVEEGAEEKLFSETLEWINNKKR